VDVKFDIESLKSRSMFFGSSDVGEKLSHLCWVYGFHTHSYQLYRTFPKKHPDDFSLGVKFGNKSGLLPEVLENRNICESVSALGHDEIYRTWKLQTLLVLDTTGRYQPWSQWSSPLRVARRISEPLRFLQAFQLCPLFWHYHSVCVPDISI
jgi:hypothetical protein